LTSFIGSLIRTRRRTFTPCCPATLRKIKSGRSHQCSDRGQSIQLPDVKRKWLKKCKIKHVKNCRCRRRVRCKVISHPALQTTPPAGGDRDQEHRGYQRVRWNGPFALVEIALLDWAHHIIRCPRENELFCEQLTSI
jgi:hypothetical protein